MASFSAWVRNTLLFGKGHCSLVNSHSPQDERWGWGRAPQREDGDRGHLAGLIHLSFLVLAQLPALAKWPSPSSPQHHPLPPPPEESPQEPPDLVSLPRPVTHWPGPMLSSLLPLFISTPGGTTPHLTPYSVSLTGLSLLPPAWVCLPQPGPHPASSIRTISMFLLPPRSLP